MSIGVVPFRIPNIGYRRTRRFWKMNGFVWIFFPAYLVGFSVESRVSIPEALVECYENKTVEDIRFVPVNLRILLDILRKAERYSRTTMDMRIFSASLLRRFKFDGIMYSERANIKEGMAGIIPYAATGRQRKKHELMEELVPGDDRIFPSDALSLLERCLLHRMISNTIYRLPPKGDEGWTTIEYGVIETAYGTVAPGTIIGALAAALQRQIVPLDLLYSGSSFSNASTAIDNVWLTTLAGDLAEVTVHQGPLAAPMTIGASGIWESKTWPTLYKLASPTDFDVREQRLDATQAEIITGIDGLVVAHNALNWLDLFHGLRLSQLLDAYYSHSGVDLDGPESSGIIVNGIVMPLSTLLSNRSFTYVLRGAANAHITDEALGRMADNAVDTFIAYAESHLYRNMSCRRVKNSPRVEAILLFVGNWAESKAIKFLAALIEELDVSAHGSKIGILDGTTGEWVLNVTNSPALAYSAISKRYFRHCSHYGRLNFTGIFEKVYDYLDKCWERNREDHVVGNLGQAIVLLFSSVNVTEDDRSSALLLLKRIKRHHPDVHFLYYALEPKNTSLVRSFVVSGEDDLISGTDPSDIAKHLCGVPTALRPPLTGDVNDHTDHQFEDYTRDSQTITYKIHSHWRMHTKALRVTVHGFGYGVLHVCSSNQTKVTWNAKKIGERSHCRVLRGHDEISFVDYTECTTKKPCSAIYYHIRQVSTLRKCTELDCKSPNQVRYIIRMRSVHQRNSSRASFTPAINLLLLSIATAMLRSRYKLT